MIPAAITLDDAAQLLEQLAVAVASLTVLVGAGWKYLLGPKVRELIAETRRSNQLAERQLSTDQPGTVAQHARVAANAARELPELRGQLGELLSRLGKLEDANLEDRVRLLEVEGDNHGRRLGSVEQAVIAYLGGALGVERAERLADHDDRIRAQERADLLRERTHHHEDG